MADLVNAEVIDEIRSLVMGRPANCRPVLWHNDSYSLKCRHRAHCPNPDVTNKCNGLYRLKQG